MVSHQTRSAVSRERLLAAASAEFAARGFSGAKVDRIAARARLNKAMIYYHFRNKAALYREILTGVFQTIASAVASEVVATEPETQLRQFVRVIARIVAERPDFAAIWLRELAGGGRHIDTAVLTEMRRILATLSSIIRLGVDRGCFLPAHPVVAQVAIVGPILMFAASAPARERLARADEPLLSPERNEFLEYIERAAIGALRPPSVESRQSKSHAAPARQATRKGGSA